MRARTLIAAALCAAGAALPAGAQAATIALEGGTLVVRSDDGPNTLLITGESSGELSFSDAYEEFTSWPEGTCTRVDAGYPVWCQMPQAVRAELGGGDDTSRILQAVPAELPVHLAGQGGNDQLSGGEDGARATLDGGDGGDWQSSSGRPDTLLGGGGNDELIAGAGADVLRGGDGDDVLSPGDKDAAPDVVDGGAGRDVADGWGTAYDDPPTQILLDGLANDGGAGEGDDVRDVETIRTFTGGTYAGTDGPETFENFSSPDSPASSIDGRGGDDVLTGGSAQHTIAGGAGDDRIEGGFGHDTLTGGPGRDQLFGDSTQGNCGGNGQSCPAPFGNDVIDARDGEADTIDCGVGEDRAIVDPVDTVAQCEVVDGRAAAGTPAGGKRRAPGSPGAGGTRGARITLVAKVRLGRALRSGLRLRLTGLPAGRITVRAALGSRRLAVQRVRVGARGTATVTLRFGRAARRALAGRRRARIVVTAGGARTTLTLVR